MIDVVLLHHLAQGFRPFVIILLKLRLALDIFFGRIQGGAQVDVGLRHVVEQRKARVEEVFLLRAEPGAIVGNFRSKVEAVAIAHDAGLPKLAQFLSGSAQGGIGLDLPRHVMGEDRIVILGMKPAGPGGHQQKDSRRHGRQPAADRYRLPWIIDGEAQAISSGGEILNVQSHDWAGHHGKERNGPFPISAEQEKRQPNHHAPAAPARPVQSKRDQAQSRDQIIGDRCRAGEV